MILSFNEECTPRAQILYGHLKYQAFQMETKCQVNLNEQSQLECFPPMIPLPRDPLNQNCTRSNH